MDAERAPGNETLAAVSDWHVFRLFVTVPDGTEMRTADWTPAAGEPVSVQVRHQHMIGWNLSTRTPITMYPGDLPEGVITPTGTVYLYAVAGDPLEGGRHCRDVAELKDTVLETLRQVYAQARQRASRQ